MLPLKSQDVHEENANNLGKGRQRVLSCGKVLYRLRRKCTDLKKTKTVSPVDMTAGERLLLTKALR